MSDRLTRPPAPREAIAHHTPAPWAVYDSADKRIGVKIRAPEQMREGAAVGPAICTVHQHFGWEQTRADARRIADCVNACEGIPDPARFRALTATLVASVKRLGLNPADEFHAAFLAEAEAIRQCFDAYALPREDSRHA